MLKDGDDFIGTARSDETPKEHHKGWNLALDRALDKVGRDGRFPPREEPYDVEIKFVAEMKVTNPGDIKTYGIIINPLSDGN